MPSTSDFSATGKVMAVKDGQVVFIPRGTRYELQLKTAGQYTGPTNTAVDVVIRATARKVWTVPSGGNFIVPIVGPPKIIQGRVRSLSDREIVVHAGANFVIELPALDSAIDLPNGPITVGRMVNVTAQPGASLELVTEPAEAVR